jgi:membrane-associated phospholipid phosphatase
VGQRVSLKVIAAVWLALLLSFVSLALRASTREILQLDVTLERWVQSLPDVGGDVFSLANWLGNGPALSVIALLVAAVLIYRRDLPAAALMLLTYVPRMFNDLTKLLVSEPRPSATLVRVEYPHDNLSFPSGHVVGVTVTLVLLFVLAPRLSASRPVVVAIQAFCVFFVVTVSLARMWVGAHWPTDTLGAYIYSSLFLIPALVWLERRPARAAALEADRVELPA